MTIWFTNLCLEAPGGEVPRVAKGGFGTVNKIRVDKIKTWHPGFGAGVLVSKN